MPYFEWVIAAIGLIIGMLAVVKQLKAGFAQDNKDADIATMQLLPPGDPIAKLESKLMDKDRVEAWAKKNGYKRLSGAPPNASYFLNRIPLMVPLVVVMKEERSEVSIFAYLIQFGRQFPITPGTRWAKLNFRARKAIRDVNELQNRSITEHSHLQ